MRGDSIPSYDEIDRHIELLTQWVAALKICSDRRDRSEAVIYAISCAAVIEEGLHEIARGLGLDPDTDRLHEMLRRPAPKARPRLVVNNTKEE